MADDLEARLTNHARAFEGLMSLIPAKHYYTQDNSDQYKKKKQTKEQKREAKRAKLNPASHKSAQDVLDDMDRKRKRELEIDLEGEDSSDIEVPGKEKPREGMKPVVKKQKKEKTANDSETVTEPIARISTTAENDTKKQAKLEKRKEKLQRRKEKEARFKERAEKAVGVTTSEVASNKPTDQTPVEQTETVESDEEEKFVQYDVHEDDVQDDVQDDDQGVELADDNDMEPLDIDGIVDGDSVHHSTATPTPPPDSPSSAVPSTSSTSSIVPPAITALPENLAKDASLTKQLDTNKSSEPAKKSKLPKIDHEVLKERLHAKLEQLRAARKADGIDGKPAKNRQELLEARRRKQEERKNHKKEMRKLAKDKEEEQKLATEAELARLRGSGSPLGSGIFSPRTENNFSFGRVVFDDGVQLDANMSSFRGPSKKKGPGDVRTTLQTAEKKQARLNGLDEEKRKDIEEKNLWLNAKKKTHGEKVRDDTSLLKKTLKRKEKQKGKSEKEWSERIAGVQKSRDVRQHKREENLKKRRDEKGQKGKKVKKPSKKPKGRPGFEGGVRSKKK